MKRPQHPRRIHSGVFLSARPQPHPCFCTRLRPPGRVPISKGKAAKPACANAGAGQDGSRKHDAPSSRPGSRPGWEPRSGVQGPLRIELPSPGPSSPGSTMPPTPALRTWQVCGQQNPASLHWAPTTRQDPIRTPGRRPPRGQSHRAHLLQPRGLGYAKAHPLG